MKRNYSTDLRLYWRITLQQNWPQNNYVRVVTGFGWYKNGVRCWAYASVVLNLPIQECIVRPEQLPPEGNACFLESQFLFELV